MRLRVLVACEYSGRVRDAFRALGHDAWSCDLLPTETPGPHLQGDVLGVLRHGWDLMVAHPTCTYLCNSGAKHLYRDMRKENGRNLARWRAMRSGAQFFRALWDAPIPYKAIENPIMHGHAQKRVGVLPSQILQPWQFGHGETKATCLWLDGLPPLEPTNVVDGREQRVHRMPPSEHRWKERSRTYAGVASAMALQWSAAILEQRAVWQRVMALGGVAA